MKTANAGTEAETTAPKEAAQLWREASAERRRGRLHDALFLYDGAAPHFETDPRAGDFAAEFADLLSLLGGDERRDDYLERARALYASAERHFEQSGDAAGRARAAHALARLSLSLGRHADAHRHLERARAQTTQRDGSQPPAAGLLAALDETRARVLLAEERVEEAEASARAAVGALEAGGPSSPLASALTAHGAALARLAQAEPAHHALRRAADTARAAGDAEAEGLAALVVVEELCRARPFAEVAAEFDRAVELLAPPRGLPLTDRLLAAARRVVRLAADREPPHSWRNFSLREAVHRFEAGVIGRALADAGGSVSRAAHLLGFRHHNSLASILNHRHRELLAERSPVRPRRRSIITVRARARVPRFAGVGQTSIVLHVEDDPTVADAVRVALEAEGCRVETCADGLEALARLRGSAPYDLLLLDHELPGAGASELTRAARSLPHRRATPVIVFSASDVERAALDAGADLFLRKPQGSHALGAAVRRLLQAAKQAGRSAKAEPD